MSDLTAPQKLARLKPVLEQALKQQSKPNRDAEFEVWLNNSNNVLDRVFGSNSAASGSLKAMPFKFARNYAVRGVDYTKADQPKSDARFQHDVQVAVGILRGFIAELELEVQEAEQTSPASHNAPTTLAHLHPTIQQAAGSLYATGHYRQALLDAFIAVDNAVQDKAQLTDTGTKLMEVAFSPGNPILKIGNSTNEQQGFLSLFRGAMLAIRNPKAHSLNGTHDAQRALEWLSFASVLLRNLDEAELAQPPATPPAP